MDEVYCSACAVRLMDSAEAYGITRGTVDQENGGLLPDLDSEWVVLCADCMNDVDRLMATLSRTKTR